MDRKTFRSTGVVAGTLLAMVCVLPTQSQAAEELTLDQQVAIVRSLTEAQRQATMAANVTLTEAEAAAFWPVYRDYRNDVAKINDKLVALIKDYAENYAAVTDAKAKTYTKDYLDTEAQRIALKSKYVSRYDKVLAPAKTARVLQIETKLDAMVDIGLAKSIPLVQP